MKNEHVLVGVWRREAASGLLALDDWLVGAVDGSEPAP